MNDNGSDIRMISALHTIIIFSLIVTPLSLANYGFHRPSHGKPATQEAHRSAPPLPAAGFYGPSNHEPEAQELSRSTPSLQPASIYRLSNHESEPQAVARTASSLQTAGFDERTYYVPDRIVIPSIELDTPVVDIGWNATTDRNSRAFNLWDVADFAAGWHVNSDQLGEGGNVVLSGHNNIRGAVFQKLDQLEAGDMVTIWAGDKKFEYEIDEVVIIRERGVPKKKRRENARWIGEFDDDRITLVSCWPKNDNSHRIIVVGHFMNDADDAALSSSIVY